MDGWMNTTPVVDRLSPIEKTGTRVGVMTETTIVPTPMALMPEEEKIASGGWSATRSACINMSGNF